MIADIVTQALTAVTEAVIAGETGAVAASRAARRANR